MRGYTEEQKKYIAAIAPGRYNKDIADMFNAKFNTDKTESQIKSFKSANKIISGIKKKRRTKQKGLFTKEQAEFIIKNVKGVSNQDLADLINKTFNLSVTWKQVKTWKKNHKLSSGLKGTEGKPPPNKGTKGLYNVGGNKTSFKPGRKPSNYLPIGAERVSKEGYVLVKVSNKGPWHHRWKLKHKVLWEEVNGPIPKGHCLVFLDRNRQNTDLTNLQLITNSQLARLNQNKLLFEDPELTKTGVLLTEALCKIHELEKSK